MIRLYLQPKLIKKMEKLTANEFRLGNKILRSGNIWDIFQIEKRYKNVYCINDVNINFDNSAEVIEMCQPIPLTEEWLLKFGFEAILKNSAGKVYSIVNNGVFSSDLKFILWEITQEKGKIFRNNLQIKAVHQLQNLYFSLTNEELKLND